MDNGQVIYIYRSGLDLAKIPDRGIELPASTYTRSSSGTFLAVRLGQSAGVLCVAGRVRSPKRALYVSKRGHLLLLLVVVDDILNRSVRRRRSGDIRRPRFVFIDEILVSRVRLGIRHPELLDVVWVYRLSSLTLIL